MKKLDNEEIQKIEKAHENFRDLLVALRERTFYKNESIGSDSIREMEISMSKAIRETKEILDRNNIKTEEELKEIYNKFLIPDFISNVFELTYYIPEDEIDCGI